MTDEMRAAIIATAARIGAQPIDLATTFSYETAGTFDPWKAGPTTQWGQHRGLIQWGEPQRQQYGVTKDMPVAAQVDAAGNYLIDAGFRPGMGLLDMYSAVNAGRVGRYNASDANNGGAPGTVADKVNGQMEGHKAKAAAFLGGEFTPTMPGEAAASAPRAPFSLSGPVGSSAPAPTIPVEAPKAEGGPDLGAIMKMLSAASAEGAPTAGGQGQAAAPALPPPRPVAPRPVAFDATKFFGLLPTRR